MSVLLGVCKKTIFREMIYFWAGSKKKFYSPLVKMSMMKQLQEEDPSWGEWKKKANFVITKKDLWGGKEVWKIPGAATSSRKSIAPKKWLITIYFIYLAFTKRIFSIINVWRFKYVVSFLCFYGFDQVFFDENV
jgi:hypothetical protein